MNTDPEGRPVNEGAQNLLVRPKQNMPCPSQSQYVYQSKIFSKSAVSGDIDYWLPTQSPAIRNLPHVHTG